MASINKVILIGNLGADPVIRTTPSGTMTASISIATTDRYTDKSSGEIKETSEWHKVIFWNRLAEIVQQYLKKGSSIYVEGKIKTRKWQDKDGQDHYTTEIFADQMQMLGSKQTSSPASISTQRNAYEDAKNGIMTNETLDDDIPF